MTESVGSSSMLSLHFLNEGKSARDMILGGTRIRAQLAGGRNMPSRFTIHVNNKRPILWKRTGGCPRRQGKSGPVTFPIRHFPDPLVCNIPFVPRFNTSGVHRFISSYSVTKRKIGPYIGHTGGYLALRKEWCRT